MARSETLVNPLAPLSLLEAVRDADRPEGFEEAEYVPELLNKRLGTTDTVYTQIRRYGEAMRRGHPVSRDEVIALARLIARRPDARAIFSAAGVAAARAAYDRLSGTMRTLVRLLPGFAARPLARRQARKLLRRYFGVTSRRAGQGLEIDVPRAAPLVNPGGDVGRAFYDAALHELLHLLGLAPPERAPMTPASLPPHAARAELADMPVGDAESPDHPSSMDASDASDTAAASDPANAGVANAGVANSAVTAHPGAHA